MMVRGILTALNWFLNNQLHAFSPSQTADAFRYLKVQGAAERAAIEDMVSRLRAELARQPHSAPSTTKGRSNRAEL